MSRITAWGNSHGVRIPREVLEQADIAPESEVTITAEAGRIVIELPDEVLQMDEAPRGREVL